MDISNMNLVELKALAFDLFSQKGAIEQNLKVVSDRMVQLGTQAQMETPGEVIAEVKPEESTEKPSESVDKSE